MIPPCNRCGNLSTGLWTLDGEAMFLCGGCGLGFYPTTNKVIKLISNLFEPAKVDTRCITSLRATGVITKLGNGAVFLEMACTACSYMADFSVMQAAKAQLSHTHERHSPVQHAEDPANHLPQVQLDEEGSEGELQS